MRFALDTSGVALEAALHQGIDLLKMSLSEFQSICGSAISEGDALAEHASRLAATGAASMIALALGERGAVMATPERRVIQPAMPVQVRSSVGAGDGFLARLVLDWCWVLRDGNRRKEPSDWRSRRAPPPS